MFNRLLDPQAQLALMCMAAALVYWNNDQLFYLFSILAFCSGLCGRSLNG